MKNLYGIRDNLVSDLSIWSTDTPGKDLFMIGNGRVCAALGWGERLTDLGWILGPYYETDFNRNAHSTSSYFGTQTARLFEGDVEVCLEEKLLGRVRQTDIMVSRLRCRDGLQWDTIDFCHMKKNEISRIMIFENTGMDPLPGYRLELEWRKPEEDKKDWNPDFTVCRDPETGLNHMGISLIDAGGRIRKLFAALDVPCDIDQRKIYIRIPPLLPGNLYVVTQLMIITVSDDSDKMRKTAISEYVTSSLKDTM